MVEFRSLTHLSLQITRFIRYTKLLFHVSYESLQSSLKLYCTLFMSVPTSDHNLTILFLLLAVILGPLATPAATRVVLSRLF